MQSLASMIFAVRDWSDLNSDKIRALVHAWLSDLKNTRWLMVFDNHDDPDQFNIESYLPPNSHGAILITTRRPDLIAGEELHLKPMKDTDQALHILRTRSKRRENLTGTPIDPPAFSLIDRSAIDPFARRLADRIDGLPLALTTAGVYLRSSTLTYEAYFEEYERRYGVSQAWHARLPEYR